MLKYELHWTDGNVTQEDCPIPPVCNGQLFMFKDMKGMDMTIPLHAIKFIKLIYVEQGKSKIIGLNGRPADEVKGIDLK